MEKSHNSDIIDIEPIIDHLKDGFYIGLDVGGTLIKLVMLCKKDIGSNINFCENNVKKYILQKEWMLFYLTKKSNQIADFINFLKIEIMPHYNKPYINSTGGGCVKFKNFFEESLDIKLIQLDEINSLFIGISLFIDIKYQSFYQFDACFNERCYAKNRIKTPFFLANIGSGVSYLKN